MFTKLTEYHQQFGFDKQKKIFQLAIKKIPGNAKMFGCHFARKGMIFYSGSFYKQISVEIVIFSILPVVHSMLAAVTGKNEPKG